MRRVSLLSLLLLCPVLINLTACTSMSGNVVPASGPPMEQVYDAMKKQKSVPAECNNDEDLTYNTTQSLESFRKANSQGIKNTSIASSHSSYVQGFHRLPNPELSLYITPHFAGRDQVPVPGYTTAFNAYERDYYDL